MVSPQSRIRILEAPTESPGVCCLCGSAGGDKRTFLDFGKQLDWYGAVYFCSECINECVLATGHVKVLLYKELNEMYKTSVTELEEIKLRYEAVKHALSFTLDGSHLQSVTVDDFVGRVVDAVAESRTHEIHNQSSSGNYSDVDESCDVEGLDDVFNTPEPKPRLSKPPKQRDSSSEV